MMLGVVAQVEGLVHSVKVSLEVVNSVPVTRHLWGVV